MYSTPNENTLPKLYKNLTKVLEEHKLLTKTDQYYQYDFSEWKFTNCNTYGFKIEALFNYKKKVKGSKDEGKYSMCNFFCFQLPANCGGLCLSMVGTEALDNKMESPFQAALIKAFCEFMRDGHGYSHMVYTLPKGTTTVYERIMKSLTSLGWKEIYSWKNKRSGHTIAHMAINLDEI